MKSFFKYTITGILFTLLSTNSALAYGEVNAEVYGILTVLPPLIAIVLAFISKNVILSLFTGTLTGCVMIMYTDNNLFYALIKGFHKLSNSVLESLADTGNAGIVLQVLTIGALIALITKMGGINALAAQISKIAKTASSSQFATWLLGLCIFFDDYANTLTVGPVMRTVTDRMRVSREKLAFIIDATAAPIAGMALISTWVAYEVGLIKDALSSMGLAYNAYGMFVSSLPFRFYNLLIFAMVLCTVYFLREIGPMHKSESRARLTGETIKPGSLVDEVMPDKHTTSVWYAVIPVGTLILTALAGFYINGRANLLTENDPETLKILSTFSLSSIQLAFGASDASRVLFQAALTACVLTLFIGIIKKQFTLKEGLETAVLGIKSMNITAVILLLAWSLSSTVKELGTAYYIVEHLSSSIPQFMMPAMIFILGSVISFATGTSYGTMGILMPLTVPLAWAICPTHDYLVMNIGAVLTGAIFGDHCSPISDTTILSSMGAGCGLLDHVKTQMPYALITAAIAVIAYIMAGFNMSVWIILGVCIILIAAIVRFAGKKIPNRADT